MLKAPQRVPEDSRWRPVKGFPNYWISQYGQIFNMKRLHLMARYHNTKGYLCVRMYLKDINGSRGRSRVITKLMRENWPEVSNDQGIDSKRAS